MAEAHTNLGIVLSDLWRHAEALASFDAAIALNPDLAEAHYNRGKALGELGRYEAALASHDKAIALRPDYGEALWNQTLCLLQLGQFERGWQQFEYRHQFAKQIVDRRYPQPVWLGQEDIAGKTLFIYWEQGFGDTLQFCRYVGLVKALGAQVILSVQDPLVRLLQQSDPEIRVIGGYETACGIRLPLPADEPAAGHGHDGRDHSRHDPVSAGRSGTIAPPGASALPRCPA